MTDTATSSDNAAGRAGAGRPSLFEVDTRTRRRHAAEARFRAFGLAAIGIGLFFLLALLVSILRSGIPAFTTTVVQLEAVVSAADIETAESALLKTSAYEKLLVEKVNAFLADRGAATTVDADFVTKRLVPKSGATIRDFYQSNPDRIGDTVVFELPAATPVSRYFEGDLPPEAVSDSRFLMVADLDVIDIMIEAGLIRTAFDWNFLTGTDTAVDNPGGAGIGASVVGSFFMMVVVLVLSLPIGVAASIYLEEFAPRNRLTDLIEVNISNLAAVPSIVFGILGLAVFIQFLHLPQSAPLVGGLVLTLMTLPTIIITTRASLKAVPPSIRDAALGVGASRMQAVFHHVLPLAAPGILTGTIIGLAQALGETAPLLLIGMVGYVAREYPDGIVDGFLDSNSAMPAQIYTWAARADAGFYEKAWGGIIVLLLFLLSMNLLAIILRRRFERRW